MRHTWQRLLGFALLVLSAGGAFGQGSYYPQTLPPNTLVGRLGAGTAGPAEAIPFNTIAAQINAQTNPNFRTKLTANVTYYVAPASGGLADCSSIGNACTLGLVYQKIKALDLNGKVATVQLIDGLYTSGLVADGPFIGDGWADGTSGTPHVIFQGNASTPTNVEITTATGPCFQAQSYARVAVKNMWLRCVYDLYAIYHGQIFAQGGIVLDGVSVTNSMFSYATRFGYIDFDPAGTFAWLGSGTPDALWNATHSGNIRVGGTWNAAANRTFAIATAYAEASADITFWNTTTFSLGAFSVTGKRFEVDGNAVIQYVPGTLTTLPGSLPGTEGNGGHYYFTFDAFVGRFWSNTVGTTTSADLASSSRFLQLSGESAFTGGSGAFINLYSSTNSLNPGVVCIGTNSNCYLDVLPSGGVISGSHGDPGANNFGAGGTIDAVGTISSSGPAGGFIVKRRDTAAGAWTLYSSAGSLQLNDSSGDRWVMAPGGGLTLSAGINSSGANTGTLILSGSGGIGVGGNINATGNINAGGTIGAGNLIATGGAAGGFFMANRATGSTNWIMYNDANIVRWNDAVADRLTLSASSVGLNVPLTYGGITFSNSVSGSGPLVGGTSPAFTGTLTASALTASGAATFNLSAAVVSASATATGILSATKTSSTAYTGDSSPLLVLRSGVAANDAVLVQFVSSAIVNNWGIKRATNSQVLTVNVTGTPVDAIAVDGTGATTIANTVSVNGAVGSAGASAGYVVGHRTTGSDFTIYADGSLLRFNNGSDLAMINGSGEHFMLKNATAAAAPGASYMKLSVVAGTNAGSCKLIAYAGTSSTPVTIVDNVGSGC